MARKENGLGSVSLRADGRYSVSIMRDGKRHTTTCNTKAQANKKLKEIKEQIIKNDMSNVKRMTVQSYMDDWLHNIKRNQIKPTSYDRLEQTLKYQVYPSIGRLQINSLKPANVQAMVNDVSETKSYSTAKKAYEAVNACFKLAVIKREVIYNPAVFSCLQTKNVNKQIYHFIQMSRFRKLLQKQLEHLKMVGLFIDMVIC